MTLSARYVAMMKSCSTMNAVFLACMMKRLITCSTCSRLSDSSAQSRNTTHRKQLCKIAQQVSKLGHVCSKTCIADSRFTSMFSNASLNAMRFCMTWVQNIACNSMLPTC